MSTPNRSEKVCAVLVLYKPCHTRLTAVIHAILPQLEHLLIVDNTPVSEQKHSAYPQKNCTVLKNDHNKGLASAQNQGIQWALSHGYEYILLMDQDSIAAPDMVTKLMQASKNLQHQAIPVAATGPRYGRAEQPVSSFIRLNRFRYDYLNHNSGATVACSFLISSGSLIVASVLREVGLMDESLFIDHIDTEWCFRAQSRGYRLYGVNDAFMQHDLGERQIKLWLGRERHLALHAPFRLYYIFRNSILLYRRAYMPLRWKLIDLKRLIFIPLFYLIFSAQRTQSLYYIGKGILHGLQKRSGSLHD